MEPSECRGYTKEMLLELNRVWNRWHLNDMRAGTPEQEKAVRWYLENEGKGVYSYEAIAQFLETNGLLYDDGYKYGSGWLKEEVPLEVIEWLFTLPGEGDSFDGIFVHEVSDEEFNAIINF